MKNAKGLVEYVKVALAEQWGYVWGTFGTKLDGELLENKLAQYPQEVGKHKTFIAQHWMGRKVADCVGLIKSFIWWDGSRVRYDPKTDVSANGMYQKATVKGAIGTMPDLPGLLIWKDGHIGVYIGGGEVIEAHGTKSGVIKTPLTGPGATHWTHWLKCPYLDYDAAITQKPAAAQKAKPTLQLGAKGQAVKDLQISLNKKGAVVSVDGDFGAKTLAAVKAYQKSKGLVADGIVGPMTWSNLE